MINYIQMGKLNNKTLKHNSQNLRKNMTKQERHLWYDFFKKNNIPAKRQKIFGGYIVDFYIPAAKIVVELDGGQHYNDVHLVNDAVRNKYFANLGIEVIRYSNLEIDRQFDYVCNDIAGRLGLL